MFLFLKRAEHRTLLPKLCIQHHLSVQYFPGKKERIERGVFCVQSSGHDINKKVYLADCKMRKQFHTIDLILHMCDHIHHVIIQLKVFENLRLSQQWSSVSHQQKLSSFTQGRTKVFYLVSRQALMQVVCTLQLQEVAYQGLCQEFGSAGAVSSIEKSSGPHNLLVSILQVQKVIFQRSTG